MYNIMHSVAILAHMHQKSMKRTLSARDAKLRRLDDFRRRNPHVTASALESLMRDVSQHGLPELFSRNNMNEAKELLTTVQTPHGTLHQHFEVLSENG